MTEKKRPGFMNDSGRNKNSKDKKTDGKRPKFSSWWLLAILVLFLLGGDLFSFGGKPKEIPFNRFESEMLLNKEVEKLVIVNNGQEIIAEIYIKEDYLDESKYDDANRSKTIPRPNYAIKIDDSKYLQEKIEQFEKEHNVATADKLTILHETRQSMSQLIYWLLPIGLIILLWVFMFRRMSGGGQGGNQIFNVGKSKAQLFDKEKHVKVDFKDVAGLEEAKVEVMEIVDFLKNPKQYTDLGGKIPKGALLVGPPGTGKTLLAKAVAGEANVPFFSMSGSDFVEMFVGVGASRVRDLFRQAKSKAPCIVFIDEIDAIGRARGKNPNMGSNDERENTLNQLLTEMDGFGTNSGVIILAATNRADILDKALMRAGRFDRQIHVELPDLNEREAIFKVHTKPIKMGGDVDVSLMAKQTPGFSGADIANVCNEAALIAARNKKKQVEKSDFLAAVDRIIGGLERKNKIISKQEKRTIAFHEAGHATVSWLLENANPLVKVTIIPRGRALGAAWYLPEERQITTTEQMLDEMCATLGGRAAEEVMFDKISTGALNDLERVTKQALAMVTYFGMSEKVGNLSYYDSSGQSEFGFTKPYSDKTAEMIDAEVKSIVEDQFNRAKQVLRDNMEGLKRLAEILLEKEVIFSDDVEEIFGPRKGEEAQRLINGNGDSHKKEDEESVDYIVIDSEKSNSTNNDNE